MLAKQMLYSGLLGGFAEWSHLVVSYILDDYMDIRMSNFIGLLVDMVLDFFLQFWLFLKPKKKIRINQNCDIVLQLV